jgi:hypothetical protein
MTLQQQANAILARMVLTVCDGWTTPRHPRRILSGPGDPEAVSHGMCADCLAAMNAEMDAKDAGNA